MGTPRRQADRFLQALGVAVLKAREEAGITQEELGFRSEIDRTYISGVERGLRNPTVKTLRRLADALKTKGSALLRDAEDRLHRP